MPILNGTSGPDVLSATAGSLESWTLNGLDGDDTLNGSDNNDILDGGAGADIMRGYWGFDIYYVDHAGDQVIDSDGSEVRTTLASYSLPIYLWKLTGLLGTGQTLTGNYSNNILTGGAGDDRLWGGAGIDQLIGGAGNDTYILQDYDSDRSDTIVEAANGGIDEVLVGLASYTLAANVENATATGANITLTGNNLDNVLRGSNSFNDSLDGGTGADTMIGGGGSDWYYVDNAGDVVVESLGASGGTGDTVVTGFAYYQLQDGVELLQGTAAKQTLVGNDGHNWLMSKGGGDTLIGGLGDDLYEIQTGDVIVENVGEGIDLVRTTFLTYTLPDNLEELQATSFTNAQTLIGNAADNRIIGTLLNTQSDTIDGRAGADRMIGYHGSDVYYVDNVGDTIEEESHHGTADQVRTTVDYTAPVNVELLVAWAGTGLKLTGNGLVNTITGGAGNDILIGGGGADSLEGGAGGDAFAYLSAAESTAAAMDRIRDFESGADQIRLAAVVPTAISWSQQTDASNGSLYNLVIVNTAGGTMQIRVDGALAMSDFVLSAINGTAGADSLTGTAGADDMNGLGGDDVIDGRAGADWLTGGAGNDTYFADNAGDRIVEAANEGFDVVAAALSYTLTAGAHVELMTTGWIEGTAEIHLAGNELGQQIWSNGAANLLSGKGGDDTLFGFGGGDTLLGNEGNDVLFGGAGAIDTLYGGTGDDTYFADDSGEMIGENAGEGHDVAAASVDYTLGAGASIELMTTGWIGGTATIALTGNELGNEIWGNDGVNALSGAAGSDALIGFGGDDRLDGGTDLDLLVGGTGQDSFVFANALNGAEADIVADFSSADDTILLDDAVFAGLSQGALNANAFVAGTAALDADDRILYDAATGKLWFDADGNGAGAAVQFAILSGSPALAASDFLVV